MGARKAVWLAFGLASSGFAGAQEAATPPAPPPTQQESSPPAASTVPPGSLLAGQIPFATASRSTRMGTLVVPLAPLGGTVRRGERLFVLTADRKGILARAVVAQINPSGKSAQVRLVKNTDTALPAQIVAEKLAIVRADQLQPLAAQFNAGPIKLVAQTVAPLPSTDKSQIIRTNPLVELQVTGHSEQSSGLRVVSGSDIKPQLNYTGFQFTVFAPPLKSATWLNMFGLSLHQRQFGDYQIKIVRSNSANSQTVKLSGEKLDLAILFRLHVLSPWLSTAGIRLHVLETSKETIALSATDLDTGGTFTLNRKQSGLEIELLTHLLANFFIEAGYSLSLQGEQTAEDSLNQTSAQGSWQQSQGRFGGGIRTSFSLFERQFALTAGGTMIWRNEAFTSEQLLGSGTTQSLATPGFTFGLGLSFIR